MRLATKIESKDPDNHEAVWPKPCSAVSENVQGTRPWDGLFHSMFSATSNMGAGDNFYLTRLGICSTQAATFSIREQDVYFES
jgi:hypothetical protein